MFVRTAEPRWNSRLSYICTRCSSAINITDLRSYALQSLAGIHRCPTFVRTACLPPTSLTYIRMHCRTPLVRTAVRHLYVLRICHHYHWLHSYALLFCHQHHRPPFVHIAEPRCYISTLSVSAAMTAGYIRMLRSPAVIIANLCSHVLQNFVGRHRCPTSIRAARLPSTSPTAVRTRCRTSSVCTAVLHSYTLLVCRQHRRPPFVCVAEPRWYAPLSYIRTRCSSAIDITDLRSYVLQNLTGMHRFLHSYVLLVCCQHRHTPFARIAEPLLYVPLSYIRTRCLSAVILHAVLLRIRISPLALFSLTYVRTCA